MAQNSLLVQFDQEHVIQANENIYKLCFAFGVGFQDHQHHNVVAWESVLAAHVQITWEEKYKIAATKDTFSNGVRITASSEMEDISFADGYTLSRDWSGQVSTDQEAPQDGFIFHNESSGSASAIIYKLVNGKWTPAFVSPGEVFSKGQETIIPTSKVSLWLQRDVETGNMIDIASSRISVLDLAGKTELKVHWSGSEFVVKDD